LTDDRTLVEGCLAGHESYRCELYKRYAGKMFVVCKRYAGSKQEAEDYLQESFIRVFEKLKTFNHAGSLEGWVRRVVVTSCLNLLRSRKIFGDINDAMPVQDTNAPGVLADMEEKELLALVQQLPTGYRTVFNLYAIDGYDHSEIATLLHISEGTSRSQLAKARMNLREAIEKHYNIKGYAHQV